MKKQNKAGLYMRLSKEDGEKDISSSIENQRKILTNYACDNGFTVFGEYIDDGFSGTNFQRPSFLSLQEDIIEGNVNVVITKDFSRLGRNTGKVMTILDDFFVKHGVRYISVTEGIDTGNDDFYGMLAPMLSFTNEMYAGDISRKINASFNVKMKLGEYIGPFAPFGYKKDPENKNHLIIDYNVAHIVKKIFSMSKEGYSVPKIADYLNANSIITPSKYKKLKNYNEKWTVASVKKILNNEVYFGHTVQGKTHKVSFKSDYVKYIPKDQWIRVLNTHEAIVNID